MPDYNGIELKARRTYSKSAINLFTVVPDGDKKIDMDTHTKKIEIIRHYMRKYMEISYNLQV